MTLQELKVLLSVQTKTYKTGMKEVETTTSRTMSAVRSSTDKMESGTKRALAAVRKSADGLNNTMNRLASTVKATISVAAITAAARSAVNAAQVQSMAETRLATVMRQRMQATNDAIDAVKRLTSEQQQLGIIGDEVQIAGAQQLSTFLTTSKALKTLIPAMNDLVAQQKGYSATTGDAVNVGNLMGKVMQGQTSALTRVGITFTEAEEAVLKYGDEQQRAAMLAQVITNNVGRMNSALAQTPYGRIQNLKNNFGDLMEIVGDSIANVISPVVSGLNWVVGRAITAANAVKAFTAMFSGGQAEPISLAADVTTDLADSYGGVASAADDMAGSAGNAGKAINSAAQAAKKALAPFDEIHKITESAAGGSGGSGSGGGSGSSGAGGGGIVSQAFNFGKVDTTAADMVFPGFEEAGRQAAASIKGFFDEIPWTDIQSKVKGVSGAIAEFINGLTSPDIKLGSSFGDTIAGAINTAIAAESGFVNKLKFENIGNFCAQAVNKSLGGINWQEKLTNASKLGTGIATAANTFIRDTDFTLVGSTVANYLNTKINAAFGFSETFDFTGLGAKIGTAVTRFFKETDFHKAGQTVSNFLVGGINAAAAELNSTDFEEVGTKIGEFLDGIDWPELSKAGGNLMGALIKAAIGAIKGIVGEKIQDIKTKFSEAFTEKTTELEDAGVPAGQAIWGGIGAGIVAALKDPIKWVKENIFTPFWEGLKGAFQTGSPAKQPDLIATAGDIGQGILDGIAAKFKNMKTWVEEKIVPKLNAGIKKAKGWVTDITMTIKGKKDETFNTIKKAWDSIKKKSPKITAKAEDGSKGVLGTLNGYWKRIKDKKPTLTGQAVNKNSGVLDKLKSSWDVIETKTSTVTGKAVNKTGSVLKGIKEAFASIGNKDVTVTGRANNATPNTLSTLKKSFDGIYNKNATITATAKATTLDTSSVEGKTVSVKIKASGFYDNTGKQYNMTGMANGGIYAGGQWHDIARYASGGLPSGSQLFWAREAGPELVGTLGGHTAVMNNDQIVSSVSAGVFNAVKAALAGILSGGGQAPTNDIIITLDGETLYRAVLRGQKTYDGRYATVCAVQ